MTLSALGFPHLRSDDDQRRRNLAFDRAIVQDRMALAAVDTENFPLGWYVLLDGRRVYGHNDLELRAMARESWRVQRLADLALEVRLDALRSLAAPFVASMVPSGFTADLFAADCPNIDDWRLFDAAGSLLGGGSSPDVCQDAA